MTRDDNSVTLAVLNFNGHPHLERCIDSLLKTDYPNFKIIVVDNASSDGSVEYLKSNYPDVGVIEHRRNYGYAKGYNLAMDSIEDDYVVLLNNDVVVKPSWLKKLMTYIDEENVAAVTPLMTFLEDKTRINAAGGNCDIYGVGWNRGNGEVDVGQYNEAQEVFYGNGGALLIKKSAWLEIGPFDERYFMYGEDLDWCWRAKLKGYKIIYAPTGEVYHLWRGCGSPMVGFLERHWLSTALKHYSLGTLIALMPKYVALKILKTVWLILCTESPEKLAVPKGILWNLLNLRKTWKKRVTVQSSRKLSDDEIKDDMFRGSFELLLWLGKLTHPILDYMKKGGRG